MNPHKTVHQLRAATAIADTIFAAWPDITPDRVVLILGDPENRRLADGAAGVDRRGPRSDDTWRLAAGELMLRIASRDAGASATETPELASAPWATLEGDRR